MTWPRQGTANATRLMLTMEIKDSSDNNELIMLGKDPGSVANQKNGESTLSNQARILLFTQHAKSFLIRTTDSRVVQVETPLNSDASFRSVGA